MHYTYFTNYTKRHSYVHTRFISIVNLICTEDQQKTMANKNYVSRILHVCTILFTNKTNMHRWYHVMEAENNAIDILWMEGWHLISFHLFIIEGVQIKTCIRKMPLKLRTTSLISYGWENCISSQFIYLSLKLFRYHVNVGVPICLGFIGKINPHCVWLNMATVLSQGISVR